MSKWQLPTLSYDKFSECSISEDGNFTIRIFIAEPGLGGSLTVRNKRKMPGNEGTVSLAVKTALRRIIVAVCRSFPEILHVTKPEITIRRSST